MIKFQFCPICGGGLKRKNASLYLCAVCNYHFYQNSKPTASAMILKDNNILLGKRAIDPFMDYWNIPGGFLLYGEDPKAGARREAFEETGLDIEILDSVGIFMDEYGPQKLATINIAYTAKIIGGEEKAGDDIKDLQWFSLDNLPENIAFLNDRMMLDTLKKKLKVEK